MRRRWGCEVARYQHTDVSANANIGSERGNIQLVVYMYTHGWTLALVPSTRTVYWLLRSLTSVMVSFPSVPKRDASQPCSRVCPSIARNALSTSDQPHPSLPARSHASTR